MVPAFSKRDDSLPQGALWHKTIFQDTTCPGGDSGVKYFQAPNGTDAGLDALHWALVVPANAAGWTADVLSNGKTISSKALEAGLNYGTVQNGVQEGTQRLVIRNGDTIVAGTDRGRCLDQACRDGIYNFNPQVMPVKVDYDKSDCWQVEGEPILDYRAKTVTGTTLGPRDADPGHANNNPYAMIPFDGYLGCSTIQKDNIRQAWRDVVTILNKIPPIDPNGLLEQRNFGADIAERQSNVSFINSTFNESHFKDNTNVNYPDVFAGLRKLTTSERTGRRIRVSCMDIPQVGFKVQTRCNSIKGAAGTIGGYAFDDATSSPGGTIVLCDGFFAPGQEHLPAVLQELRADASKQKESIFMTGKFRLLIHELVHLPSVSHSLIGSGKGELALSYLRLLNPHVLILSLETDVIIEDQYIGADQQTNEYKVYMPVMVEKLARMRTRRHLTTANGKYP